MPIVLTLGYAHFSLKRLLKLSNSGQTLVKLHKDNGIADTGHDVPDDSVQ